MLAIELHVHIWQVSPQLSCGDTCQIWMRFKECKRYFCEIENFAYGEIDERSFSNPTPGVTKPVSSVLLFSHFFSIVKEHVIHVYWMSRLYFTVSPQLSCGDTCQIWTFFKESILYFYKIENFADGEINERNFDDPTLGIGDAATRVASRQAHTNG